MTDPRRVVHPTDRSYGLPESSERVGPGSKSKGDRTRRSWTVREEEILMATLKDLVAHGWKSENGFRPGYLTRIEEALKKEFPNSDLKGTPHINSKITQWKKSYYSLMGILGRSGVGFNMNRDFKIDCDNDQWEQIVKVDANARLMRNKSWPLWEDWKEVFGKDRATGGVSEVMHEAFNDFSPNTHINVTECIICVIASQIANVGESVNGASLQEKEGFKWLNNDVANIINISLGSSLAVLIQQQVLRSRTS